MLEPYQVGILASVVSELLKYIPLFKTNDLYKSLMVLAVAIGGTWIFSGLTVANFGTVILSAFVTYKMLIQPVAKEVGLKSQG